MDEKAKVAFIISGLYDRACKWELDMEVVYSKIYLSHQGSVHHKCGKLSVMGYFISFRTLAAASGWNEAAFLSAYCHGLNPRLKIQLSVVDETMGLERFMQYSLQSFEPTGELRLETIILDCFHLSSTISLCGLGVHASGFLAYLCILETALEIVTALLVLRLVQSLPSGVFVSSVMVSSIQQYSSASSTLS